MDARVKKLWVAALLSGDYTQGRSVLNKNNTYCCLGVLCDLAVREGVIGAKEEEDDGGDRIVMYGIGHRAYLPTAVMEWAGLEAIDPLVGGLRLSEWNDGQSANREPASFTQIAELIETHL